MSRRTASTIRRPRPHAYAEDPAAPGTCATCHLLERNDVHRLPDNPAAELDARRLGEHPHREDEEETPCA